MTNPRTPGSIDVRQSIFRMLLPRSNAEFGSEIANTDRSSEFD